MWARGVESATAKRCMQPPCCLPGNAEDRTITEHEESCQLLTNVPSRNEAPPRNPYGYRPFREHAAKAHDSSLAITDSPANDTSATMSIGISKRIGRPMALRQASAEQRGSRGATAGTGLAGCDARFEVPRGFLSTLKAGFFSLAQTGLETALLAGRPHRGMECRQRLWMSMSGSSTGDA